jgi:uncharacterized protein (TIGR02118 family)
MVKLIALYKTPAEIEEFEKQYFETYTPLVEKIPGLLKSEVAKLSGLQGQESTFYMMTEMYFEDMDRLNEAMASAEGKAAGRNLMNFAKDYAVMFYGEVKK